jgi:hypothetical protein
MTAIAWQCTLALLVLVVAACGPKLHIVPPLADGDPDPIRADVTTPGFAGPGSWAVSAGGPGPDGARLAVDGDGNNIIAGEFRGTTHFGPTTLTAAAPNGTSTFVAKLDPTGQFVWAIAADATCHYPDEPDVLILRSIGILFAPVGLGVDGVGNIYVAAPFTGAGSFQDRTFTSKGATDLVVAKLGPSGDVQWTVSAGGAGDDVPLALAADKAGNVTVTGFFTGEAAFGGVRLTAKGTSDIFVARLDTAGNFVWAVQAGGDSPSTAVEFGSAVALDELGNAHVGGEFVSTAIFGGHLLTTAAPCRSGFLAKLDPSGKFLWATEVGSKAPWWSWIGGIALDASGNSYLAGAVGQWATSVAKLDPDGAPVWVDWADGNGLSWANGIVVDAAGSATVSAAFAGTISLGEARLTTQGNRDVLVARLDTAGRAVSADQAGGSRLDSASGLAVDRGGNLYVVGHFHDTAMFGGAVLTSRGLSDVFVWKRPPL